MTAPGSSCARVVVTRAESRDGPLSSQLRTLGLEVLLWPAVSVTAASGAAFEQALARIEEFDWIVFASRAAVAAVINSCPRLPASVRVAAIGRATAQVLRGRGFRVDLMPNEANAASLVNAFATEVCAGARILYPASSRALPTIAQGLTQMGAEVLQVEAYRTEAASLDVSDCRAWIDREVIGAVTFASPRRSSNSSARSVRLTSRGCSITRRSLPSVRRRRVRSPSAARLPCSPSRRR